MSQVIVELVRSLRPADAGRVDEIFPPGGRRALFEQIVSVERPIAAAPASRRLPPRRARPLSFRGRGVWRPALIWTLGAASVATVAATLLITGSAVRPQSAAGAVAFRTVPGGEIVATVTDPFAAESRLKAAFAEHGLDITVSLVPVSPRLVGTIVYTSDNGGASAIQPLQGGHCVNGGGGCAIGLKIPATFTGKGYVTLGRPAKSGETYDSAGSAFAPGEALHCSGLLGAQVTTALPVLRAHNLKVQWREEITDRRLADGSSFGHAQTYINPPATDYIWDAVMLAPGSILVSIEPTPWPADAAHGAAVNQGC